VVKEIAQPTCARPIVNDLTRSSEGYLVYRDSGFAKDLTRLDGQQKSIDVLLCDGAREPKGSLLMFIEIVICLNTVLIIVAPNHLNITCL
jgi:hypothetical protein